MIAMLHICMDHIVLHPSCSLSSFAFVGATWTWCILRNTSSTHTCLKILVLNYVDIVYMWYDELLSATIKHTDYKVNNPQSIALTHPVQNC